MANLSLICATLMSIFVIIILIVVFAVQGMATTRVKEFPGPGLYTDIRVGLQKVCVHVKDSSDSCSTLKSGTYWKGGRTYLALGILGLFSALCALALTIMILVDVRAGCLSNEQTRAKITAAFFGVTFLFTTAAWVSYACIVYTSDDFKKVQFGTQTVKLSIGFAWFASIPMTVMSLNSACIVMGSLN
eukprot:a2425_43.p1 GENE.a2425_43~~a2425_43.p1  ORF type:complete len:201 (+),score=53.20 a2425_43:42-605(+)